MKLSDLQIAVVANQAGFKGSDLPIAVAVALAESGGDSTAVNTANSDGSTDQGLFQINSVHHDLLSQGRWDNPTDNARMAYAVWHGSGWTAWTTYSSGKYLLYMSRAKAAATGLAAGGTNVPDASTATGSGTKTVLPPKVPYPTRIHGSNATFSSATYDIQFHGKWFLDVNHAQRTPSKISGILNSEITVLAQFVVGKLGHAKDSTSDSYASTNWIKRKGKWSGKVPGSDKNVLDVQRGLVIGEYCGTVDKSYRVDPTPLPDLSPERIIKAVGDFISFITDSHNWVRLAYFVFGGALVLFAAYKVSGVTIPPIVKAAVVA